ncbi:hypothetical protein AGLY_007124 [Aphis glycines]|uniref:Uncharacterized protein n=1 Tax=Aphis glycines TaxID=307491 RepID=A0A6G0TP49_APHGL|nr:hypothetical protein AGLY_007124 [Aphis glycines]
MKILTSIVTSNLPHVASYRILLKNALLFIKYLNYNVLIINNCHIAIMHSLEIIAIAYRNVISFLLEVLFFLLTMNLVRLDWRIMAVDLMTNLWACDVCDAPWSVARDTRVFPPGGGSVGRHKPTTSVWRILCLSRVLTIIEIVKYVHSLITVKLSDIKRIPHWVMHLFIHCIRGLVCSVKRNGYSKTFKTLFKMFDHVQFKLQDTFAKRSQNDSLKFRYCQRDFILKQYSVSILTRKKLALERHPSFKKVIRNSFGDS